MVAQPNAATGRKARERPLVVVSNRLPVRLDIEGDRWQMLPSSGGLVTALAGLRQRPMWIGWPGSAVPAQLRVPIDAALAERGLHAVHLTAAEEQLYYIGFCNTVLWPLLHYFTSSVAYRENEWQAYAEVNTRFADTVAQLAPRDASVWVHDFHLMLVPGMLRERRPDLQIGFFLHVPFPSSEVYRLLPRREELLAGLLGADFIGFHTSDYVRHFRNSCVRVLGLDVAWQRVAWGGRTIGVGVHPIGIDNAAFREVLAAPRTAQLFHEYRKRFGDRRVILGIERLDYTKGVGLKLEGFAQYLARRPEAVEDVVMMQVLVPSRLEHQEYQQLRAEIEQTIGHINGTHGRPGLMPIHYIHRSVDREELVALYRLASAALVTPVRDGMNLVAQEYVACQAAPHAELPMANGVLVLSEFAGAAHSLNRALLVNPWHAGQIATAIGTALDMPERERQSRMQSMARAVDAMDCNHWVRRFLDDLDRRSGLQRTRRRCRSLDQRDATAMQDEFSRATSRCLLLDYDGTLRELAARPGAATPTDEIVRLLEALARLPATQVHLVSGRSRDDMQNWFGGLPVHLCAEHGSAWRPIGGTWQVDPTLDLRWMPQVRSILEEVSREVPGSFVEEKSCALAWHYRLADVDYGSWRARELRTRLIDELAPLPVDVIAGRKVVEVRSHGVGKGRYASRVLANAGEPFVLCIGDDRTDLEMHAAVGRGAWTIHVGGCEQARFSLDGPEQVRALLADLIEIGARLSAS